MTTEVYELTGVRDFAFPHAVRYPNQLTLELSPGGVVPPSEYTVIGYGPSATGVTVRYPNAPVSEDIELRITRYTQPERVDRKSTRLNFSHVAISYAVFCLKKQK